ncbi:hypothetical protein GF413_05210 [Candidatus Micrarchaeota archaeon]|nr:hypothetical protein [Candidatus Micrarchaeota archaeon]
MSALQELPRWKKYFKLGQVAEEIGKKGAAEKWRRKAYMAALEHGEYETAATWAGLFLSREEAGIAESLATLKENIMRGRGTDLSPLVADALWAGAPLELVKFELSRPNHPDSVFHSWKSDSVPGRENLERSA